MNLVNRIIKWVLILFTLLLMAIVTFVHQVKLYPTNKVLEQQFTKQGFKAPTLKVVETNLGPVTLIDNELKTDLPIIIFIHGSPGSSQDFRLFFQDKNLDKYRLISINRLGFAKKNYGHLELDLTKQATAYIEAINKLTGNSKNLIWVGHSYGGAPAAVCANINSSKSIGLILAASPIDPMNEKTFWFNNLANNPIIEWLLPTTLKMAQKEKMTHKRELLKVEDKFQTIKAPIIMLQGENDFMSPMVNVDYGEKIFKSSIRIETKRIPNQSHFFPFHGRNHITEAIIELTKFYSEKNEF